MSTRARRAVAGAFILGALVVATRDALADFAEEFQAAKQLLDSKKNEEARAAFEKLAAQNVMQVQSATDTPKRISLGERAVMVDGAGYLVIRNKEAGQPVDIIYPEEGTPLATGPSAVFKGAPNPNAARLFQNWMHSREAQQMIVDSARQYSPHNQTVEKPGVRKLADIKLMKEDPEGVYTQADAVKKRYAEIFKV